MPHAESGTASVVAVVSADDEEFIQHAFMRKAVSRDFWAVLDSKEELVHAAVNAMLFGVGVGGEQVGGVVFGTVSVETGCRDTTDVWCNEGVTVLAGNAADSCVTATEHGHSNC